MLVIRLSKTAVKTLQNVQPKHGLQIRAKLQALRLDPFPQDTKLLKGSKDYWRVDAGEYRIIYQVEQTADTLFIDLIGKRNDDEIYRKFKRKQ